MCITRYRYLNHVIYLFYGIFLQWVGSIDLAANEEATANIIVNPADTWVDQGKAVAEKVAEVLEGNKVDAVLCVAGGWAGGNASSKGMLHLHL